MNTVSVANLVKAYAAFRLDGVSFELAPGRIAGFIGRNGAGKTTTIKSMLNLVHPDSGEVKFFGLDFSDREAEIKGRIGYSTGIINWYPRKTIREIKEVTKLFYPSWDENEYKRYLEVFRLDESKTPRELSEGMKVKVNLLLALSHHAEVLILDEPTSGLDPFSRDELLEIFIRLKNEGIAIFFSTHITSDIEKCADDIIYISGGRIVAALSRDEFRSRYSENGETLEETFLRLERGKANE